MLKIGTVRWRGKCARHPRFDPVADGPGGVRGGCERCTALAEICEMHQKMVRLMRTFAPPDRKRTNAKPEPPNLQIGLFDDAQ